MKKQITKLLGLILACSGTLNAVLDTNLTFVSLGGQFNVAERAQLTQRIAMRKEKGIGGTVQALPFFKQSSNEQKLAELLSPVGKQKTSFGFQTSGADVILDPLVANQILFSLELSPKHREFGVHLAWQQRLDVVLEGLFVEVDSSIVNVQHQLNPVYSQVRAGFNAQGIYEGTVSIGDDTQKNYRLYSGSKSKTGVADVSLRLGYNIIEKEEYRFALNLAAVVPTGGKPTNEFAFAPEIGANNAWQAGAGATLEGKIYESGDHQFRGLAELNYRYSFANTQERTLGLLKNNNYPLIGAQFASLYDGAGTSYQAANFLTTDLKVTGGVAVNMLLGFGYDYQAFSLDLGYELNASAKEKVELASTSDFKENADIRFGDLGQNPTYINGYKLTLANLDYAPVINPSKMTHKIVGSLGYTLWHDQEYPLAFGLGGSYTFGSNRSAFQGWGVFGKMGVSF